MADKFELVVNGVSFQGWTDVSVTTSMENPADSFDVAYTADRSSKSSPLGIDEQDEVAVKINGEPVIVGYVDDADEDAASGQVGARIVGRSKTADLLDCSALHKKGVWKESKLDQIARDLVAPYGIDVVANVPLGEKIRKHKIEIGESIYDCIRRAAELRGVLVLSNEKGELVFDRADNAEKLPFTITEQQCLKATRRGSAANRYSTYDVRSHTANNDDFSGEKARGKRKVDDLGINRARTLVVIDDGKGSQGELESRGKWERNRRAGDGRRFSVTLENWTYPDLSGGRKLWRKNTLVPVQHPYLRVQHEFLISGVTYTLDPDGGPIVRLDMVDPRAFSLEDPPKRKKKRRRPDPLKVVAEVLVATSLALASQDTWDPL